MPRPKAKRIVQGFFLNLLIIGGGLVAIISVPLALVFGSLALFHQFGAWIAFLVIAGLLLLGFATWATVDDIYNGRIR